MKKHRLVSAALLWAGIASPAWAAEKVRSTPPAPPSPLTLSLQTLAAYGRIDAFAPANHGQHRRALTVALAHRDGLHWQDAEAWLDHTTFQKIAGEDSKLAPDEMKQALGDWSKNRALLHPEIVAYFDYLTTRFDGISPEHEKAARQLAAWLSAGASSSTERAVLVVCTGNSRRSVLGAALGNMASTYYDLSSVRFLSAGRRPTALNPRAASALERIGVEIRATGELAQSGPSSEPNPKYLLHFGGSGATQERLRAVEYSKSLSEAAPPFPFAALLVCNEADASCPTVPGAAIRIAAPFDDPKAFDGSPFEPREYDRARDEIGRVILYAALLARRQGR